MERLSRATGVALHCDAASRAAAARDFGGELSGTPMAVAAPRDTDELVRLVQYANAEKIKLTPRGKGYSQGGMSLARDSVTVETRRFDRIGAVNVAEQTVTVGAAATWRQVLDVALQHGLAPRVLPLNLDMTVGGLLSAGGLGANSHREGPAVNHVTEAEIVTGEGTLSQTSAGDPLLASVLGGLGRTGILTQAKLALRPVQAAVRTWSFLYDSLETWLADMTALAGTCDFLEGMAWAGPKHRPSPARPGYCTWMYELRVGIEMVTTNVAAPKVNAWKLLETTDVPVRAFHHRYEPRFEQMVVSGAWSERHPWVETLLPHHRAPSLVAGALERVPPAMQDGHRVMLVAPPTEDSSFAAPEGPLSVCFAMLPTSVPESTPTRGTLAEISNAMTKAGGKRYLSGWLGPDAHARWSGHYGSRYQSWLDAKRRFDPNAVLTSALFAQADC